VALITGAARGLRGVTALAFAREGARVVLTDIDEPGGFETLRPKGGVDGLTKTAALEVAKNDISVNAIAACGIDASGNVFQQWMEREHVTPEQAGSLFPIGRMGTAEELTAAVLFL